MTSELVISCSQDATIRLWSLVTGRALRVIHNKLHIQVRTSDTVTQSHSHSVHFSTCRCRRT